MMSFTANSRSLGSGGLPRRLTLLVAAAAIAIAGLSATARPARADVEDIIRFLAGAVVIAAIVNAIDDRHTPHYYGRWELPDSCLETMRVDWRNIQVYNARCLQRGGYSNLPNRCRYEFRVGGQRTRTGYIAECMWDAGYHRAGRPGYQPGYRPGHPPIVPPTISNRNLPGHCHVTYRQDGRRSDGYWADCLRDSGFRNLPQSCRLRTTGGRHLYNAQCLFDSGYGANF